jgi:flagellar biosynthesis protein FlhG
LRRLAEAVQQRLSHHAEPHGDLSTVHRVKVLSFTSGKGGVGKTNMVVNLAYALCRLGMRVMIFDADLGLANVDVLLGLTPRFTIQHVLSGQKTLDEVLLTGPGGILILPATSGVQEMAHLTEGQRLQLLAELDALEAKVDVLLVDTGAGISTNVVYFNMAAQDIVVVVTPEPTSMTDAYALMKVMSTKYAEKYFKILMNAVSSEAEAQEVFRRLSMVAERFLNVSLDYLGFVVFDASFSQAVRQQKPLLELYPTSLAADCFRTLARRVFETPEAEHVKGSIQFFWQQLLTKQALPPIDNAGQDMPPDSRTQARKESGNE